MNDRTYWAGSFTASEVSPDGEHAVLTEGGLNGQVLPQGLEYIEAGAGNDTVTVKAGRIIVDAGPGQDLIDMSGADQGLVFAGSGDTVIGAGADGKVWGMIKGDAEYRGGSGMDDVIAYDSDGGVIDGGAGDDRLTSTEVASKLMGGDGNDTLEGGRPLERNWEGPYFPQYVDSAADTLQGGAGDDHIEFGNLDQVEGGEGSDYFGGWITADGGVAEVSDFQRGTDSLSLVLDQPIEEEQDAIDLAARLEVVENADGTVVRYDGNEVLNLPGATGLTAQINGPGVTNYDLAGNVVTTKTADLIFRGFY
ncbi:hypothetical protein G7044_11890 [Paracoccus sp. 12-3]|nr:hypothetical protein [Paracoccus xiamenensis]